VVILLVSKVGSPGKSLVYYSRDARFVEDEFPGRDALQNLPDNPVHPFFDFDDVPEAEVEDVAEGEIAQPEPEPDDELGQPAPDEYEQHHVAATYEQTFQQKVEDLPEKRERKQAERYQAHIARSVVAQKSVVVKYCPTESQLADLLTKAFSNHVL
jgi:hypothetical protein